MAFNGSGTFSLIAGNPVVTGTVISSTWANNTLSDIASNGLSNCLTKDGQTTPTGNIPLGGFKITGLAAGTSATDAANVSSVQNSKGTYLTTIAGTNTITAQATPTLTAYTTGQEFTFIAAGTNTGATTINIDSVGAKNIFFNGAACVGGEITSGKIYTAIYDGTQFNLVNDSAVGQPHLTPALRVIFNTIQDFRLTLTTAVPVTTADVTGATTIYCTPYKGTSIALFDGTNWNLRTSAEFSLALGTLTGSLPYDIFCYDNSTVPTLEFLAWTNATTRATALAYQDGILVKSGATTRRYLGTFYTSATTTTEDSVAKRYLWNYYNRVSRAMQVLEGTNTWNYTTATIRQANGAATNQLDFVSGVADEAITARVAASVTNTSTGVIVVVGIGLDSTTVNSAQLFPKSQILVATGNQPISADYRGIPAAGRHTLTWLEYSQATGTTTWSGNSGTATLCQSGIFGEIKG